MEVSNDTDCRAGTVWRCDMDGTNLELIAHNFRNNYECCVDSFGEIWLSDNDDDGNQQTRICFVMPGGNYGYHPRGPGQTPLARGAAGHRPQDAAHRLRQPDRHHVLRGLAVPQEVPGALLHCDAGPREVRWFFRKPKGAGYELDKEVLLTSSDNWFRPSDVCVAPDGSIFVADWYDRGVGGHGMGDPHRRPHLPHHPEGPQGVQGAGGEAGHEGRRAGGVTRRTLAKARGAVELLKRFAKITAVERTICFMPSIEPEDQSAICPISMRFRQLP